MPETKPIEIPAVSERPAEKARAPKHDYPGALVVVEGIDGSGKSTQLYLLKRWLEINGYRTHFTEWNSSPLVKSATRRGKQRRLLTPVTFSLLHAADFADRCERQILASCSTAGISFSPIATYTRRLHAMWRAAALRIGCAIFIALRRFPISPFTFARPSMWPSIESWLADPSSSTTKLEWTSGFRSIARRAFAFFKSAS